jgi:hypothetical protein
VRAHNRSRRRIRGSWQELLTDLAPHVVLDGSGGGAVAFRDRERLSLARWHRPEDRDQAVRMAMGFLADESGLAMSGETIGRERRVRDAAPSDP